MPHQRIDWPAWAVLWWSGAASASSPSSSAWRSRPFTDSSRVVVPAGAAKHCSRKHARQAEFVERRRRYTVDPDYRARRLAQKPNGDLRNMLPMTYPDRLPTIDRTLPEVQTALSAIRCQI